MTHERLAEIKAFHFAMCFTDEKRMGAIRELLEAASNYVTLTQPMNIFKTPGQDYESVPSRGEIAARIMAMQMEVDETRASELLAKLAKTKTSTMVEKPENECRHETISREISAKDGSKLSRGLCIKCGKTFT